MAHEDDLKVVTVLHDALAVAQAAPWHSRALRDVERLVARVRANGRRIEELQGRIAALDRAVSQTQQSLAPDERVRVARMLAELAVTAAELADLEAGIL